MGKKFDFCGWATRANVKCADGRTILKDAFADQDGMTVPLVWNHQHDGVENVLGHAILQARPEGMYTYCTFNNSENGRAAKEAVRHGDVGSLSIWANKLQESANGVAHGIIREVSLVLAGANPEARIESFMEHSGFSDEIEAMIYTTGNTGLTLEHSDDDEDDEKKKKKPSKDEEVEEKITDEEGEKTEDDEEMSEEENSEDEGEEKPKPKKKEEENKKMAKDVISHADDENQGGEKTIKQIVDTMNEEQKNAMYALIGAAVEGDDEDEEEDEMKHNMFDEDATMTMPAFDMRELIQDGRKYGSLKEAYIAHGEDMGFSEDELIHADMPTRYGIMPKMDGTTPIPGSLGIDALFPEARYVNNMPPEFIKRDTGWVDPVMNGVSHSPFARFKTIFADITEEEARARGYVKGTYKKEEVFSLLKREITPQTVYKKQRFDKDDLTDITDFDVLSWVKAEMRMMLDEEIARAILVGDGRSDAADSKIYETHVKSIYHDDDFYANKVRVDVAANASDDAIAKATIRAIILARKDYKGSGNPTFFCPAEVLSKMLLLEDANGRIIYDTEEKLRTALRVSRIVEVEVMEGLSREVTIGSAVQTLPLIGIIVNLMDYRVGADKGGAVSMFEDFDIDYNQQKFLIETRISGMLIKPHSAMVIELSKGLVSAQG